MSNSRGCYTISSTYERPKTPTDVLGPVYNTSDIRDRIETVIDAVNRGDFKSVFPQDISNEDQINGRYDETHNPMIKDTTNPKDALGSKKVSLSLIPPVANILEAKVMELGAAKYKAFNWRETSIRQTVYQDATLRHLYAIMDGQDIDPESGISHWAHIRANTGIVLDAKEQGTLVDDRKTPGRAAETLIKVEKT